MYKLIAFAVLAFFFMFTMLYYAPTFKFNTKKTIIEKEDKESYEEKVSSDNQTDVVFPTANSDNTTTKFESISGPRNDALSHKMDEKYFLYYDVRSYEEMHMNLQERLDSLSEAKMKSEKGKQVYDEKL